MERADTRPAIRVAVAAPFGEIVGIHRRAAEYADEIHICVAVSDATRVLEQTHRLQPDVLLLSRHLGLDDADLLTQLASLAPSTRLVMVGEAGHEADQGFADAAVRSDAAAGDLRDAIVGAAANADAGSGPPAHTPDDGGGSPTATRETVETAWFAAGQGVAERSAPSDHVDTAQDAPSAELAGVPVATVRRTAEIEQPPGGGRPPRLARVVAVFSGTGGVGTSIVATNLATVLALAGSRVALVDLDLQYGDLELFLHLETHPTTIEMVASAPTIDGAALDAALAAAPGGAQVLLCPRSPELADQVTAPRLAAIMTALRERHEHIIIDCSSHLEQRVLEVMEVADRVLLVTSAHLTAVKNTKVTLRLLQSLGIARERVALVLNHARARACASAEDVEATLRFPLLAQLPYEPSLDESIERGVPHVLAQPRSPLSRQVMVVAERLEHEHDAVGAAPAGGQARWRLRFGGR